MVILTARVSIFKISSAMQLLMELFQAYGFRMAIRETNDDSLLQVSALDHMRGSVKEGLVKVKTTQQGVMFKITVELDPEVIPIQDDELNLDELTRRILETHAWRERDLV